MLINIITNLPTVEANSNNKTKQELQLSSNNQLSTLQIAGIVIGIVVGIGSFAVAIYMCWRQRNTESNPQQDRMSTTNDGPRQNIQKRDNIGSPNFTGAYIGGDNFAGANISGGVNIGDTYNYNSEWYWHTDALNYLDSFS